MLEIKAHLEAELALNKKEGSLSRRDSLLQASKQTGIHYAELDTPDLPPEITQEWMWFTELSCRRPIGFSGICTVPFSEYLAWMEFAGVMPNKLQKRLLADIDTLYVSLVTESTDK